MKASILSKLERLQDRYEELEALLGVAEVIMDQDKFRAYSKEYAELENVVNNYGQYVQLQGDMEEAHLMLAEDDGRGHHRSPRQPPGQASASHKIVLAGARGLSGHNSAHCQRAEQISQDNEGVSQRHCSVSPEIGLSALSTPCAPRRLSRILGASPRLCAPARLPFLL